MDLPGYGFARRAAEEAAVWRELTEGFFTKNKNFDLVKITLQLIDLQVGPTEDDLMMINFLRDRGLPFAIIATKSDKPNKTERAAALERLKNCPEIPADTVIIPFSAKSGEGREEVRKLLLGTLKVKE